MKYRVSLHRVQTAERFVRAADEGEAAAKIQAELDRPFGFPVTWATIDTVLEVSATENPLPPGSTPSAPGSGKLLLSVLEAAELLGISRSMAYQLMRTGELEHIKLGNRTFISREHLGEFIAAHSRAGG